MPRYNSPLPTFSTWLRQCALDAVGSENGVFFSSLLCYWCWCVDVLSCLSILMLICSCLLHVITMNCCRCCYLSSTCCCWRCPNPLLVNFYWKTGLEPPAICACGNCLFALLLSVVCSWLGQFVNNPWVSDLFFQSRICPVKVLCENDLDSWTSWLVSDTLPETNSHSTWKWMVGILSHFLLGR